MTEIDMLEEKAVDAAINNNWKLAFELNEKILKLDGHNLAACLRLGFAYMQSKNNKEAKKYYQKALRIQPKNHVATENLERLKILGDKTPKKASGEKTKLNPNLFLEVPGKTKSVVLVNIGQKKDLAELVVGQEVELKLKKRKVEARTKGGSYVGSLPDDLSKRLIFFLKAKSEYTAFIKEASLSKVVLFIQEKLKGKKVSHFSSFPHNIQTNMNQMTQSEDQPPTDIESEEEIVPDEDEWDIEHELPHEEKEELVEVHQEEDEVEE